MAQSRHFSEEFWKQEAAFWAAVPCLCCRESNCPYSKCETMGSLEELRKQKSTHVADPKFRTHVYWLLQRRKELLEKEMAELTTALLLQTNVFLNHLAGDVIIGEIMVRRADSDQQ